MRIGGLQKFSMIDYPDKISAVIFCYGCNFSCPFCHNPELVFPRKNNSFITENEIYEFLNSRINKLDAVVLSGGEPTIQQDILEFTEKIKNMGFLIKLDTNGSNPQVIKDLLKNNLINYIAMDIKTTQQNYHKLSQNKFDFNNIKKSINLIMNANIDYEFRTTLVKPTTKIEYFEEIGQLITGSKKYYLQKFIPSKLLDKSYYTAETFSNTEIQTVAETLKKYVKEIYIR